MNTLLYSILYCIIWPFFNLFHPCRAVGWDRIPEGGAVVCSNHTRLSDPLFVVFALTRRHPMRFMAKKEIKRWPIVGPFLDWSGLLIWVDRGRSDVSAIKQAMKTLLGGGKLLIFPEGTRSVSGEAASGKTGAAMLAIRTGVPLVPVYIPAKKKWFQPTTVVFGEPYLPFPEKKKAAQDDYRMVTEQLMQRIEALKGETS